MCEHGAGLNTGRPGKHARGDGAVGLGARSVREEPILRGVSPILLQETKLGLGRMSWEVPSLLACRRPSVQSRPEWLLD